MAAHRLRELPAGPNRLQLKIDRIRVLHHELRREQVAWIRRLHDLTGGSVGPRRHGMAERWRASVAVGARRARLI
jgi:hypothetical protein